MSDTNSPIRPAARPLRAARLLRTLGPLIGLVFVWALFAALTGATFIRWDNQRLMLLQTAVVGTAAVGATMIIISGGIDLSVGSTIALGTMVVALVLHQGGPSWLGALGGPLTGMLCGLAIGAMVVGHVGRVAAPAIGVAIAWIAWTRMDHALAAGLGALAGAGLLIGNELSRTRLRLSPFIVTLGMWGALRGLAKGLGDNQPIYPGKINWLTALMSPDEPADWSLPARTWAIVLGGIILAMCLLWGLQRVLSRPARWGTALAAVLVAPWLVQHRHEVAYVAPPGVWMLGAAALFIAGVLHTTVFGRHVFAIGSNEHAARLCGIPVERTKLLVYILGVGCAGLAALLQFSYLSMGDPTTAGGYELKVIAAVVIGGATLSGGEGSVRGTLIGALIMTVVDNGCTKLGLENWVQEIVTGAIIVAAVALDRLRHRSGS